MKNKILLTLFLFFCISCSSSIGNIEAESKSKSNPIFLKNDMSIEANQMNEKILYPLGKISIPTRNSLLPNAIRSYRNGIHEGIDFISPYNTPVYASLSGIVVVANITYKDLDIGKYNSFLKTTKKLNKTPKDIYTHVLLGKYIIIDHGFGFIDNFRTTTTYAHLSKINNNISSGTYVNKGDLIGYVGNTGTKYASQSNKLGAHLHWEMHFENDSNIYYLGENIANDKLIKLIKMYFEGDKNEKD